MDILFQQILRLGDFLQTSVKDDVERVMREVDINSVSFDLNRSTSKKRCKAASPSTNQPIAKRKRTEHAEKVVKRKQSKKQKPTKTGNINIGALQTL